MIYLPFASAMDVRLQPPVPQLASGEDRPVEREDRGTAGVGSFPGRKSRCFSQNVIAIGPRENAFPTSGPAVALDGPGSRQ